MLDSKTVRMIINPVISMNIKRIAQEQNITMIDLSNKTGLKFDTLKEIVIGEHGATLIILYQIAFALNVSITDFFVGLE